MKRVAVLVMGAVLFSLLAIPAFAHTEFESSDPSDQEVVDERVSQITVSFTLPVTLVGNGFEVLDPQGNVVIPRVETNDDTVFTLALDEPLAGGDVGVRFEVTAEDGHVLAGGFSFTVTASPATTLAEETTTTQRAATSSATLTVTTSTIATTPSVPASEDEAGSMTPLLIGLGVVAVGGAGLYAGMRSRS